MSSPKGMSPSSSPEADEYGRKRKRNQDPPEDELEIDVNLPEPPSKKTKRKEKKTSSKTFKQASGLEQAAPGLAKEYFNSDAAQTSDGAPGAEQKSAYGIWIGNLTFKTTKDDLREFLRKEGAVDGKDILRLHMPVPRDNNQKGVHNKGFAYVNFTTKEVLDKALALSEKLLTGRKVLIKDAKNFEGRPIPKAEEEKDRTAKKEPTKKVFVGNLSFDVTRDELSEFLSPAGKVEDVFLATFEDSGKCKGFGWVRFTTIEAATKAVKGFVYENEADESDEEGMMMHEERKKLNMKKPQRKKRWINRLHGRMLRCEFAEDAQTRYKKRFRKESKPSRAHDDTAPPRTDAVGGATEGDLPNLAQQASAARKPNNYSSLLEQKAGKGKDDRREDRRKRHEKMDARTIAPGQANANTPRASGAIVAGTGTKMRFD